MAPPRLKPPAKRARAPPSSILISTPRYPPTAARVKKPQLKKKVVFREPVKGKGKARAAPSSDSGITSSEDEETVVNVRKRRMVKGKGKEKQKKGHHRSTLNDSSSSSSRDSPSSSSSSGSSSGKDSQEDEEQGENEDEEEDSNPSDDSTHLRTNETYLGARYESTLKAYEYSAYRTALYDVATQAMDENDANGLGRVLLEWDAMTHSRKREERARREEGIESSESESERVQRSRIEKSERLGKKMKGKGKGKKRKKEEISSETDVASSDTEYKSKQDEEEIEAVKLKEDEILAKKVMRPLKSEELDQFARWPLHKKLLPPRPTDEYGEEETLEYELERTMRGFYEDGEIKDAMRGDDEEEQVRERVVNRLRSAYEDNAPLAPMPTEERRNQIINHSINNDIPLPPSPPSPSSSLTINDADIIEDEFNSSDSDTAATAFLSTPLVANITTQLNTLLYHLSTLLPPSNNPPIDVWEQKARSHPTNEKIRKKREARSKVVIGWREVIEAVKRMEGIALEVIRELESSLQEIYENKSEDEAAPVIAAGYSIDASHTNRVEEEVLELWPTNSIASAFEPGVRTE